MVFRTLDLPGIALIYFFLEKKLEESNTLPGSSLTNFSRCTEKADFIEAAFSWLLAFLKMFFSFFFSRKSTLAYFFRELRLLCICFLPITYFTKIRLSAWNLRDFSRNKLMKIELRKKFLDNCFLESFSLVNGEKLPDLISVRIGFDDRTNRGKKKFEILINFQLWKKLQIGATYHGWSTNSTISGPNNGT